jgi:hypothetical protein
MLFALDQDALRLLLLGTRSWQLTDGILVVATFTHFISPWPLLLLTFALSIGDVMIASLDLRANW